VEWQLAQIIATFGQDIESAELHFVVVLAGVERVEVGDTVHAEDNGLAVEYEPLLADLAPPRRSKRLGYRDGDCSLRGGFTQLQR
jgi:hypothetical protein